MYLIPKDLNSRIKITRHLHLKEFIIFILGMGVVMMFNTLVTPRLYIEYYSFSFLAIGYLILPAKYNPGKNNYEAIYYAIIRNRNVFHSISIIETLKNENDVKKNHANLNNIIEEKTIGDIGVNSKSKLKVKKKIPELVRTIEIPKGSIVILKNKKMFYVRTIDYLVNNFEAYRILNSGLDNLLVRNTIPFKKEDDVFLNNKSSLSLKKSYLLKCEEVKEVKGILPKDTQETVDSVIEFLKSKGELQDKILN
jgi:hypothetical protein